MNDVCNSIATFLSGWISSTPMRSRTCLMRPADIARSLADLATAHCFGGHDDYVHH
jgi:hypothetical protein